MHRALTIPRRARRAQRGGPPLLVAAAVLALTACQSVPAEQAPERSEKAEKAAEAAPAAAQIATVTGKRIDVRAAPGGDEIVTSLKSPNEFGADRAFLVEDTKGAWLKVLLPIRPNGSTGWVKKDEVRLSSTALRLEVDAEAFTFTVYDGAAKARSGEIGIGESKTPTPPGRYYFTELLKPPNPDGDYGAYAFGLSGFSPTLETFAGGPGQLAVHGTDDESALGRRVSHGCIRVSNKDITWMAENLPIGTPVEISG